MKKTLLLFLAMLPMVASAYDACINGIYYNFFGNEAEVATLSNNYEYSGDLVIPETVTANGKFYLVTRIGHDAFMNCKNMTSITIPSSVTHIDEDAFHNCKGLTSVHIRNMETWFKIVFASRYANPLYYAKHLFMNGQEITDLIIPENITIIGKYAFDNCLGLTSITIHSGVTEIGIRAFEGCDSLIDVYCYAENPPTTESASFTFSSINKHATLHVPEGSIDLYNSIAPWARFRNIVALFVNTEINERNFPDENFRNWVLNQEYGRDGVLTEEEIANIKSINVSFQDIQSLKGIEYFTALKSLQCECNKLTNLNMSGCPMLENLHCSSNKLTELIVSENATLKNLTCWRNQLTELDVSKLTMLSYLQCFDNPLTTLDVSKCTSLTILRCNQNQLTKLNVSGCTELTEISCDGNQMTVLDVSGCTELQKLYCQNNQLTSLDISGCSSLIDLQCFCNQIKGEAMDALVARLPLITRNYGFMHVIFNNGEQNEITSQQVAVAKARNWNPRAYDGIDWVNYTGSESAELVTFTKDQMATIILPTEPDASKGKYYRLDRVEDGKIIFEQELQPQARVPYIIVPSEDFTIDPSTLNLEGLTQDVASIEGISFIGTYSREEFEEPEGYYIEIIDITPDCSITTSAETGKDAVLIGALRAYLIVSWEDPVSQGGDRTPKEKMEIMLKDYGTGVGDAQRLNDKGQMINDKWYDLQGRRIDNSKFIIQNSSQSSGAGGAKLPRGIYIKDKKKVLY